MEEPTDTGSTVAAAERRVDVEWSLLKPSRVVGDERERAKTDLRPSTKTPPETMMKEIGKIATSPKKSLRHWPHGGRQLSWF